MSNTLREYHCIYKLITNHLSIGTYVGTWAASWVDIFTRFACTHVGTVWIGRWYTGRYRYGIVGVRDAFGATVFKVLDQLVMLFNWPRGR